MKTINKLELTKEELETLEKAKQIIQNLNSYTELSLVLVLITAMILLKQQWKQRADYRIFFTLTKNIVLVWRTDL